MDNPFAAGENRLLRPPSTALVIFGASGDLTHRKLVPALYDLAHDEYLPAHFAVIGASRTPFSNEEFRGSLQPMVAKHARCPVDDESWQQFAEHVFYQPLDASKAGDFTALRERLEKLSREQQEHFNYLYYFATAPKFFGMIASQLRAAGLVEKPGTGMRSTAVVVEKPFGHDLASARELNGVMRENLAENQIFRIDHYLGKETVQNILVFRFANGIFEPLWNSRYIDNIQISVCEDIGVGGRADYFDQAGILRDIVQNHVLQVLSLLCIEPPISLSDPESIRDEKVKVLRSIRRMTSPAAARCAVRAQYARGFINGAEVCGYLEEEGIASDSATETYVALQFAIDNWRWSGVPIYVRAGKRLPKRITEIAVYFKEAPSSLFRGNDCCTPEQNVLTIQVQPREQISLKVSSKPPGPRMRTQSVEMEFAYDLSFGVASPAAYERLLLDAMKGDATLFTRDDEIEEAWDLLAPIFKTWSSTLARPLCRYPAGTWGPESADVLLNPLADKWRQL